HTATADLPAWLPHYDLDMHLDLSKHVVTVHERVTWTNPHQRPASELVFNAHAHYQVPKGQTGYFAKTLEPLRMRPTESIDSDPRPVLRIRSITLGDTKLAFHFQEPQSGPMAMQPPDAAGPAGDESGTALVAALPNPIGPNESVTLLVELEIRLLQKQGRWGQWEGVTTLCNWLPVVAVYDDDGWHPTPFIPWH